MSIIEKAAQRLEALRQAGVQVADARREPGWERSSTVTSAVASLKTPFHAPSGLEPEVVRASSAQQSRRVELDIARLAAANFLTPDAPRSELAEQYRLIKRPLLSNVRSGALERGNLIMVTSALPNEGKTFTSINLALSIATELDSRVLLIDADVRRPSVLGQLGVSSDSGLMDILEDEGRPLSDALLQTNIEKLSLLPAGTPHGHATEYLSSERLRRLLDDMRTRYADRVLIFDAPPLLPSTESRALATQVGQVVFVVAEGVTPVSSLTEAMASLANCPVVLPLLNKARTRRNIAYGAYGPYGPVEGPVA